MPEQGRLRLTASGVDLGKAPRGDVAFGAGFRAYATSKLWNLLTARAFAHSTEVKHRPIDVRNVHADMVDS